MRMRRDEGSGRSRLATSVSFYPPSLLDRVDRAAKAQRKSRSRYIRDALKQALARNERGPE